MNPEQITVRVISLGHRRGRFPKEVIWEVNGEPFGRFSVDSKWLNAPEERPLTAEERALPEPERFRSHRRGYIALIPGTGIWVGVPRSRCLGDAHSPFPFLLFERDGEWFFQEIASPDLEAIIVERHVPGHGTYRSTTGWRDVPCRLLGEPVACEKP